MIESALLLSCTILGSLGFFPQTNESYSESLQAARDGGRPLIVVLENPGKSERHAKSLYANWHLLRHFEICRLDATSPYGQKIADIYGATELPYTVITDRTCQEISFRGVGQFSTRSWEATLRRYVADEDTSAERDVSSVSADPKPPTSQPRLTNPSEEKPFETTDLGEAQERASREGRPLLVFVSMKDCHFCDKMERETLSDNALQEVVEKFETVKIKRADHEQWVEEQSVGVYPTTVVLEPNGSLRGRIEGYVSPVEFQTKLRNMRQDLAFLPKIM